MASVKGRTFVPLTERKARAILRDSEPCLHCGNVTPPKVLAARHRTTTSTISRLLSGLHRFSDLNPDIDGPVGSSERVDQLRREVQDGTYRLPHPSLVAAAILRRGPIAEAAA